MTQAPGTHSIDDIHTRWVTWFLVLNLTRRHPWVYMIIFHTFTIMTFHTKLHDIVEKNNSLLCVGLDIDEEKIPSFLFKSSADPLLDFALSIIEATQDLVCSYKLNLAFYESLGEQGMTLLSTIMQKIPDDVLVILDGKRNDIGNTARHYAKALFEYYHADAVTLNPYLGSDSIIPFLHYKNTCSFILCRTSNQSAPEFQNLIADNKPLYEHVAQHIVSWNKQGACGAVVGATYPDELKKIRSILGESIPILIPGIGAQGGDLKQAVANGTNSNGEMALITSSRGIIYVGKEKDFAQHSRKAAETLRDGINAFR
jgi:orotidine-5'-phosphate decarboxylase